MILTKKERPRDADGELLSDQYETSWDLVKECHGMFPQIANRPITLDAFANARNTKAPVYFTRKDNALQLDWAREIFERCTHVDVDLVWGQPPYSNPILSQAVQKMYEEAVDGVWTLALLPVSTSTKWWHRYIQVLPEDHRKFLEGRRNFIPPPGLIDNNRPAGDNVTVLFTPAVCK